MVAKAWADPAFKARLLADPQAVVAEEGLPLMPGVQLRVEDGGSEAYMNMPLPAAPEGVDAEDFAALVETGIVVSECSSTSCCC